MTRYKFNEVSVKATRRWTDANGKNRQKTKKFWQTISPFNIDKATGLPKDRETIYAEITKERAEWLKQGAPRAEDAK